MKDNRQKRILKRGVSVLISFTILMTTLYLPGRDGWFSELYKDIRHTVRASGIVTKNYPVNSLKDFYEFSILYATDPNFAEENQTANIKITVNEEFDLKTSQTFTYINDNNESVTEFLDFHPIGTATYPFGGKVTITQASSSYFSIYSQMPIFDYIYDSVDIFNTNGSIQQLAINRSGDFADNPLFANHVLHDTRNGTTSASWDILAGVAIKNSDDGSTRAYDYSGVVSSIGDNAEFDLTFTNDSKGSDSSFSNITSSGNLGILAGTLGAGATLNAHIKKGTNNEWNVETTGGHAGAFVGEMKNGSTLNISADSSYNLSRAIDITTTADDSYAGGLVGKNDNGTVSLKRDNGSGVESAVVYTSSGEIKAKKGAGGVFGYYRTESNDVLSSKYVINNAEINAANVGGYFGELVADGADISVEGTTGSNGITPVFVSVNLIDGETVNHFGGIAGVFTNKGTLSNNEFVFDKVAVNMSSDASVNFAASEETTSYCGGIFGLVDDSEHNPAYIKVDNLTVSVTGIDSASSCILGGVIGSAGTKGSFIDVGNSTVSTSGTSFLGGGIIGELKSGVLRLSGVTDLNGAPSNTANATEAAKRGQLVGIRKDALIYALGTGSDASASYGNGWRFVRSSVDSRADDIGTWGEVVRPNGTTVIASVLESTSSPSNSILYFNESAHTVTIASAVTSMDSVVDFVKTALNIQFNTGAANSALTFENTSASSANTLLNSNLSISGTIDLAGTGITGFMRDGFLANTSEIKTFTGTLTGSSLACVKLAVGERYGVYSSGNGRGAIYTHGYNGLFSITGNGAKISGVTIDGNLNVNALKDNIYIGGAVACANGGLTLESVDSGETINFSRVNGSNHYIGGLIGVVGSSCSNNIAIEKATGAAENVQIYPNIIVTGELSSPNDVPGHSIGGVIGYVGSKNKFVTKIENVDLFATIDASGTSNSPSCVSSAGLIADFVDVDGNTNPHDVTLSNINVKGVVIKNKATKSTGGILGYKWNKTVVDFNNVKLNSRSSGNTTVENTITSATQYGCGLVYEATGIWSLDSKDIVVNSLKIDYTPSDSLGVLLHDAYNGSAGLYLELKAEDSFVLSSGLTIPSVTRYDELAANTANNSNALFNNGRGVISIYTSNGSFSMDEANCNSYQNKYNETVLNDQSRYYYNVSVMRAKQTNALSDGEKLLLWSLNKYAASNIQSCFANSFKNGSSDTISGNFDMDHISWYPINLSSDVTLGDCTFKFYNEEINTTESANGNTDNSVRGTGSNSKSQHYAMHYGLFRNVSGNLTTTGNIHFVGNVGNDSTYTGVLVNDTLSGTLSTSDSKEIVLEGITQTTNTGYLFINKITSNATLKLYGVRTGNGNSEVNYTPEQCTTGVASSLIGDVSGTYITLEFGKIKLDGRNTVVISGLDSIYGTTKSIFSNATLLNKFDSNSTSDATYNFKQSEDWTDASTHIGKVTYGKEISASVDYAGKEKQYFDPRYFVDPENMTTASSSEYSFSTGFLPYVRYSNATSTTGVEKSYQLREIKVNVKSENVSTGCGTYNHPYWIENENQFMSVANMIAGASYIPVLRLPKTKGTISDNYNSHWCNNCESCAEFEYNNGTYTCDGLTTTYNYNEAREYLAGAYYLIYNDFSLDSTFRGLGALGTQDSKYAFRGVIIGRTPNITITNNSSNPIVKISNGCVIKDLKVKVNTSATVVSGTSVSNTAEYTYAQADLYYGGLIGMIKGGDNIVDNVAINYEQKLNVGTNKTHLYNIGGYVGVIVNGGLMFRGNIDLSGYKVHSSEYNKESDTKHLFINPYIGRVINGYAIYENGTYDSTTETYSGNYSGDSEVYTLDNTNKNYQISDVFMYSDNKLSYDTFDEKNRVNIPDGQALFILSLITQSGAGTATTANGDYQYSVSYNGITKYNTNAAVDTYACTHLCAYDNIGRSDDGDSAPSDKAKLAKESTASKTAIPYIIFNYTETVGNNYPARMMTGNTSFMKLTSEGAIYNLPKGFRGIGSLCYVGTGKSESASTDNPYQMHIYGFDGNGATINEQIAFKSYCNDVDNFANIVYKKDNINLGLGLFNVLIQKAKNDDGTNFNLDEGYFIGNFTLTGKVEVKEYDDKAEVVGGFNSANSGEVQSPQRNRYAVGGLAGGILGTTFKRTSATNISVNDIKTYTNLYNLDLSNLEVIGTSWCGGYIGRNNITEIDSKYGTGKNNIFVNACDTVATTITGSKGCCGGIIGGSMSGYPSIYVNTARLKEGDALASGSDGYYKSDMELSMTSNSNGSQSGIGAIIGCLRNGYDVKLWINNVTVKGFGSDGKFENEVSSGYSSTWMPGAGGLIGYARKAESIIVTNCNIENLNIKAPLAGGLFGNIDFYDDKGEYGTSPVIKIVNCKIYSDDVAEYKIEGVKGAGGISGQFTSSKAYDRTVTGYDSATYKYDVNGCEVYGYTVSQASTKDELCGAGGLFGFARATRANNDTWSKMRTIVNTSVHNCIIKVDGSSEKHGMGAIIGCVSNRTTTEHYASVVIDDTGSNKSTQYVCGDVGAYNIVAYNNTFGFNENSGASAKYGNFVGQSNGQNFKVVAFSRNDNTLNGSIVSADYGGNISDGSYIVCSDYGAVCLTDNIETTPANITFMNSGVADVDGGITADYFPYANVNPVTKMGVREGENDESDVIVKLSGDGSYFDSSEASNRSMAAEIINDINNQEGSYYQGFGTTGADTLVGNMLVDESSANYSEDIRLSTYDDEMGLPDESVDNFPVIALGGATNSGVYTEYIQAYIRLVTNTQKDYTSNETGVYNISVYPCRYINGYYQKVEGNQGLQLSGNEYSMIESLADSTKDNNQISLIEVQFLNPMDSNEVAYHLYIPVLTKKMVKYNFASGVLLGTEYEPSNYQLNSDNVFAGNFDNWFTSYVRYEYPRTEVQAILNTGKGLDWNSNKTINLQYFIKQDIADSTQFVLLDNNNNADKVYYLNKGDISTSYRQGGYPVDGVTLADFIDPSGNDFEIQTLNSLAGKSITYTSAASGTYVELPSEENSTVYAYDSNGGNIKYFKAYEDGDVGNRYNLNAGSDITETYYLSTYTYKTDNVFNEAGNTSNAYAFKVTCPKTLVGKVTMQKNTETCASVFLGNIFEQTLNITQESPNDNRVISSTNNSISVTAMSTIRFADSEDKEYFHEQLYNYGLGLNQGFLIYLNKYDYNGNPLSDNFIKGKPSYTYTVSSTGGSSSITESSMLDENALYLYTSPIVVPIPEYDEDNPDWTSTQTAEVTFTFGGSDKELSNEFEARTRDESLAGTEFYVESKFDYVSDNVIYSSNIEDARGTNRYYTQREESLRLKLTAMDQETDDAYDKYGENSNNRSSLGVNAKYVNDKTGMDIEHIDVGANLDVSNLPDTFLKGITNPNESYTLRLTVKLMQKQNDGPYAYSYSDVPIDTYLDGFKLTKEGVEIAPTRKEMIDGSSWTSGDGDKYVYEFELTGDPSTWNILFTQTDDYKQFDCGLSFDVLTGDLLENITGYRYANYKIHMAADLYKTSYSSERFEQASDTLVYTNAKVNAQFVSPSDGD